jgi:hypothetical protein
MDRVELPSGGWVELRDPEDLRDGDREDVQRRLGKFDAGKPLHFGWDLVTGLKLALIAAWHIPYLPDPDALPADNPALLRELKIRDADALDPYILKAREMLFPKPASVDDHDDPASPTAPAND